MGWGQGRSEGNGDPCAVWGQRCGPTAAPLQPRGPNPPTSVGPSPPPPPSVLSALINCHSDYFALKNKTDGSSDPPQPFSYRCVPTAAWWGNAPIAPQPSGGTPLVGQKGAQRGGDPLGGTQLCFGAPCPVSGYPAPFWGTRTHLEGRRFGAPSVILGQRCLVLGPGRGRPRAGSPPGP